MRQKNSNLIINICEVHLKSAWGIVFPDLAAIYTTLSRIRWSSDSSTTDAGTLYRNRLVISYPGLNPDQFTELDKFIRGLYEIQVTTEEGERYQLANSQNPMAAETKFNGGQTEITFANTAIEPVRTAGNSAEEEEPLGFPYYLTFNLG